MRRRSPRADRANEVMIGGGAEIYAQALPIADRLYITHVGANPPGDAYFPPVSLQDWKESGVDRGAAEPQGQCGIPHQGLPPGAKLATLIGPSAPPI